MISKNKKLSLIIWGAQALALLISLILFAFPLKHYSFSGDQFTSDTAIMLDGLFDVTEKGFYIDNSMISEGGEATILSPKADLSRGSYNVTFKYLTNVNTNTYTCSSKYSTVPVLAGRVSAGLKTKEAPDDSSVISVGSALKLDEYQVTFNYMGDGYLYVYGIEVTETMWWKWLVLLSVIAISIVANILVYIWDRDDKDAKAATLVIAALTLASSLPIFSVFMFEGHDIYFHVGRIEALTACIRNHQIPARISDVWIDGFGYPASVFYNDLFLVPAAILRLLGCSIQGAYKFYIFMINLVSSIVSLYCFKKVLKSRIATVLATSIFVLSPYRLICIYTRAAVGEYTGMLFYPVIFYGLYKIYQQDEEKNSIRDRILRTLPLILGISGIISSHVLTCVMAAIFCLIYVLINWKKTFTARVLLDYLFAGVVIIALNLWFMGPFVHLLSTGIGAAAASMNGRFRSNGTYLWQILSMFPKTGNSYSAEEAISIYQGDEITYAIGPALLSILLYAAIAIYRPVSDKKNAPIERRFGKPIAILAVVAIFMTTIHFPWDFLKQLCGLTNMIITNIQFPWRFLGVVMLLLSLLSGFVYIILKKDETILGKAAPAYAMLLIFCVWITASFYITNRCNAADWQLYTDPNHSLKPSIMSGEYLPRGTQLEDFSNNNVVPSDGMTVSTWRRERGRIYATVDNASGDEAFLTVPFIYYLGYNAEDVLTGQRFTTLSSEGRQVTVSVPEGFSGEVCVFYKEPGIWHLFELISVICAALLIFFGVKKNKK